MAVTPDRAVSARRKGGLKLVRDGVWRIDVELPRVPGERRRRVSRTIFGIQEDAESELADLAGRVDELVATEKPAKRTSAGARTRRARRSGAITRLGVDRWLVGVEGPPDSVTGQRRRHTRTVRGKPRAGRGHTRNSETRARCRRRAHRDPRRKTVRLACDLYLLEARTESQTRRTDSSACRRICATVLPGERSSEHSRCRKSTGRSSNRSSRVGWHDRAFYEGPIRVDVVKGVRAREEDRVDAIEPDVGRPPAEGSGASSSGAGNRGGARGAPHRQVEGLRPLRLRDRHGDDRVPSQRAPCHHRRGPRPRPGRRNHPGFDRRWGAGQGHLPQDDEAGRLA